MDGIADAGVHPLAAGGAVDMRGVTEQKSATLAEVLRHPMMHVIGREPVHLVDLNLKVIDRPAADVFELQRISMIGALVSYGSDQTSPAFARQGEDGKEVGFVEIGVQFAIERRTSRLHVGDVEDLAVGSAGKAGAESLPHQRSGAIATGEVGCLAVFLPPIRSEQTGNDTVALIGKAHHLRSSFHRDPELLQPLDQQPLMLVLREDLQEGIGGQIFADRRKRDACCPLTPYPHIDRGHFVAVFHHKVGEVELPVEFEGTRLNRQGTRGRAGLGRFVDDTHLDTELGEPQRQDEAGRAGIIRESYHDVAPRGEFPRARLRVCVRKGRPEKAQLARPPSRSEVPWITLRLAWRLWPLSSTDEAN
jgi:hypothetical protein